MLMLTKENRISPQYPSGKIVPFTDRKGNSYALEIVGDCAKRVAGVVVTPSLAFEKLGETNLKPTQLIWQFSTPNISNVFDKRDYFYVCEPLDISKVNSVLKEYKATYSVQPPAQREGLLQ